MDVATNRPTVKELLAAMDDSWSEFIHAARAVPVQRLEARLGEDAWTRKQMLAHVTAWHDLAADRIDGFVENGRPIPVSEDEETVNARAARGAGGRTTGEILLTLEESFRHLRREVSRLSNEQLVAADGWVLRTVTNNTFGHYGEHLADLQPRSR